MYSRLQNKIVFITGASSGIGAACASAFSEAGAKVILAARRLDRLKALQKTLAGESFLIELDVRDAKAVEEAITQLPTAWKNIDILLNNAGLASGFEPIAEADRQDWDKMFDTNVKGLLYVSQQVLRLMLPRQEGHIINIGSIAAYQTYPKGGIYCATKFAVRAITDTLKEEYLKDHIRVTEIDPGSLETEFSLVRFKQDQDRAHAVYEGYKNLTAIDVADAVLYAASRPEHVNIRTIVLTANAQYDCKIVDK